MARHRRGKCSVLDTLSHSFFTSPSTVGYCQRQYSEFSELGRLLPCPAIKFLWSFIFLSSSSFPASKLIKIIYNNLKILANYGRFLRIQRHSNSRYFCQCHHVLFFHMKQKAVTPCFSFWCLYCYSCQETKTYWVSKTVPQTTARCHSPKAWGISCIHLEVYIRGMQISHHCFFAFAKRKHVK